MLGKIAVLLLLVMLVTAACGDDEAAITSATVAPATSTTFTTAEPFGPEDVDGAPPTHTHTCRQLRRPQSARILRYRSVVKADIAAVFGLRILRIALLSNMCSAIQWGFRRPKSIPDVRPNYPRRSQEKERWT